MFHVPNEYRIHNGPVGSDDSYGNNGAFFIPAKLPGRELWVIASDGEEYRPVKGFETYYEVSNLGHVRAFPKTVSLPNGGKRSHVQHVLSQYQQLEDGYFRVALCHGGETQTRLVHCLVAKAFIPNPMGYTNVNHRNGRKSDNIVSNLEWCSPAYNRHHAIEHGLAPGIKAEEIVRIKVLLDTGMSAKEIAIEIGKSRQTVSDIKFGRHRDLETQEVTGPGEWPLLWNHVSVNVVNRANKLFMPNWGEMCYLKGIFWDPEDVVMQLHPPESVRVNTHPTTLHLWQPTKSDIPLPPAILVGLKGVTYDPKSRTLSRSA